ncbi:CirA Outer membrane receptor proteins, mostly Fe transport [Caulobacteraceae bacterium]
MTKNKLAFVATSALVGSMMLASTAYAQSTGTTEVEAVVITAAAGQPNIDGVITAESAPKAKASIDQEFIATQPTGQTILQSLNLTPGLNFTNNDPYGSSGGNVRLRGFDGPRISLTFDGIPLNDTGNYAIYTNQQLDPELISRASVNMGTTDVDSPTASATGGTINYTSRKPGNDMGLMLNGAAGSFNYRRVFGLVDTGEIGPWGATAYLAGSYQKYDKFKGPGDLEKWQINGKIYQPLGDNGDFVSLAFHYNENRNNFYRTTTIANFKLFGAGYDNNAAYLPIVSTPAILPNTGDVDADPSDNSNYYGLRINPSNTGNIRQQAKFSLSDTLTLTLDSAFQYVLANGGGSTTLSEVGTLGQQNTVFGTTGAVACGATGGIGFDLNKDGDCRDTFVRFYSPSNTNTRRYTVAGSLIWEPNDNNTFRVAYTFDRGRHRQTGEYGLIDASGDPMDVFGGKDGNGDKVLNADGYFFRSRDRLSYAILNQISADWRGNFMDDNLFVTVGLRAPVFKRELNQYCLTQNGANTVVCTSQPTFANVDTDLVTAGLQASANLVTLTNVPIAASGTTRYIRPFEAEAEYKDVLPNVGVSYVIAPGHTVFLSYAEGLSAPRTDNLYTVGVANAVSSTNPILNVPVVSATAPIVISDVDPETSQAWDLGYRFRSPSVIISTALWSNNFQNRIVSSFDPDLGYNVDRNVGDVKLWGIDAQAGWTPTDTFSLYASVSYTQAELQDDLQLGRSTIIVAPALTPSNTPTYLPTKGKTLVETPEWMFTARAQWKVTDDFTVGLQGKHVGDRFTTDVNDEQSPGYNVFDLDMRYDLPFGGEGTSLQLNVTNIFDQEYYANISSGTNALTIARINPELNQTPISRGPNTAFVSIGAPRTIQLSLRTRF